MPANSPGEYRLSPAARNDLAEIWRHTANLWSPRQADRYIDLLEASFARLVFMPRIARERGEFRPPVRIHPSGEHLIVYRIEEEHLNILRILGGEQDWPAHLRALDP